MKTKMRSKTLVSALMVLFIVSIIPVLAEEGEPVDLTVTVVGEPPVAVVSATADDLTVYFDGSGSYDLDGEIMDYSWDFGDEKSGTGETVSHTYFVEGTYTVTLTVTDDDGLKDSYSFTVKVKRERIIILGRPNANPNANAGKNQRVYVGEFVKFSGVNSTDPDGTIVSYEWDFGDGTEASGVNVSHRYVMEDNYTVTLTVVDDRYGEDTDNCTITVIEHAITPPPLPPYLDNLTITPEEVEPGDEVTISFDIRNTDSQSITYMVEMQIAFPIDVELNFPIDVELEAYESKTMSRTMSPTPVGIYNVTVIGMTGSFTVKSPPLPAEFVVSDLIITPEEVEPGDEVTISVLVTNIGEETGDYTITLDLPAGPFLRIQETVSLEGGESERVEFEVSRDIEGTYAVEVDGLTGSFTVKAPPKPAEFEATDLEITPEEVEEGEEVTITLKVSNIGDEEGTHTVELRIDGSLEESETVTLPGGGTEEVSFEVTRGEGSYQVEADGLTGEFTVTTPPGPPLTPGYISGIVILIVVAAVVIIYLFMERRGPFRLPSAGMAQS